jgi:uncharacterized protein
VRLDSARPGWQFGRVLDEKLTRLRNLLQGYGSCLVAYSGGVDSALLAVVAQEVLGSRMLAVIADSPSLPRAELESALALARDAGFSVRVIRTEELDNPAYAANPANRCYFCKHELFDKLAAIARADGFAVIAYGENASDLGDFRPGARAAAEFQVRAPLLEAGLTKEDIRALSARYGLPTAEKPQMACLSSRIPHGEAVTVEKLAMIEQAEAVLRGLGFRELRVRHHQMSTGPLARLELGAEEMPRLLEDAVRGRIEARLRELGYRHVTVDLQGYRRGGLSEAPLAAAGSRVKL